MTDVVHAPPTVANGADDTAVRARPIFVLGSARSGTTAMSAALARATGYRMKGEGHVWPLLLHLEGVARRYSDSVLEAGGTDDVELAEFADRLIAKELPAVFRRHYDAGGTGWIDKTPGLEMIRLAPHLHALYPDARFILMKRHPIDAIASKLRRFPTTSFYTHCVEWAQTYAEWSKVKDRLSQVAIEIDQAELYAQPEQVAARVVALIGGDMAVSETLADHLSDHRQAEQTGLKSGRKTLYIHDTDWSAVEKIDFLALCEAPAANIGYDLQKSHVIDLRRGAISLFIPQSDTDDAFVHNRNPFCCPIRGGMRLLPNDRAAAPLTLCYRRIALHGQRRLQLGYNREFDHGADVFLDVEVRDAADGTILLREELPVRLTTAAFADLELPHGDRTVDIDLTVTAPNQPLASYATIAVYRPVLR